MNVSKGIKTLLDRRGISQKELAKLINKSETSISLIMKNKTQPRKETLEAIANALSVSSEVILLLSVEKEDVPENRKEYYDILWPNIETNLLTLFSQEE